MSKSILYRYLLGAMQQNQITMTVRFYGTPEEALRLPQIIEAWRGASTRMQELLKEESGVADRIRLDEPPLEVIGRLREIEGALFRAGFSDLPTSFKIVEIDKLVAPQREVNLDYVSSLRAQLPSKGMVDLIEFCLGPRRELPEVRMLQTSPNQITFASRSLDLRFLGGFPKPIGEDDIRVAHMGGQPVEGVILLVGFGAAPMNAWLVGQRLVLANGFHRIVALRTEGISRVPIVVRHVANPEIEFPEQYLGLSRAYLLQDKRPVLVKDFFDQRLTLEMRGKPRQRTLKVTWIPEEGVLPE